MGRLSPKWSRRPGLIPTTAMILIIGAASAVAGDEPPRPPVPNFSRTRDLWSQASELWSQASMHRSRAIELWRLGKEAEAIAEAHALVELRPQLNEARVELGKFLAEIAEKKQNASRMGSFGAFARQPMMESLVEETEKLEQQLLSNLSLEDVAAHELLADLEEVRGGYASARQALGDLARIKSERFGAGHWLADAARREADRLDRLAALTPEQRRLIERGTAATAQLAVSEPDTVVGTAFCVDPRGYFLASARVVNQNKRIQQTTHFERGNDGILRGLRTTIENGEWIPTRIVLRAGRPGERSLPAAVIQVDNDLGLALLKVQSPQPLPFLEPSADRAPVEGAWACVLGYPTVPRAADMGNARSVPVLRADPTRIASLHTQHGRPWFFALDTGFPQFDSGGLTGGPVLDDEGKVIGMLVEGLAGTDTHYVIPAVHLAEFLARKRDQVDILFDPPPLVFNERKSPVDLTFDVARLDPLPADAVVEVVFESVTAGRRVFSARQNEGNLYTACVIPIPPSDPDPIDVAIGSTDNLVRIADREIAIGEERLHLRDLRRLELRPAPHGYKANGTPLSGPVTGLGIFKGRQGDKAVEIDPGAAESLTVIYPPKKSEPIPFEIVVRTGAQVLGELRAAVTYRDPAIEMCGSDALAKTGLRRATAMVHPRTTTVGDVRIRLVAESMPAPPSNPGPMLQAFRCGGAHIYQ
jgi:S1-C subfamily serine protease